MGTESNMRANRTRFHVLAKGLCRTRGVMNKTEEKYAAELEHAREHGLVWAWKFEPLTLRISHPKEGMPATYTPDFLVVAADGTTYLDDVKPPGNFGDNASLVRIKACAELFPYWVFRVAKARTKKAGGGFEVTEM